MKLGKISETVLKRSVFKQIRHRRSEVLVRPNVGEDCSYVDTTDTEVMILSTDPITGTVNDIGKLAVHITANDIASSGGEMIGIMVTLLLPENTSETLLRQIMQELEANCKELNIEIMGGHTEVTAAVSQPIISVTGVGKLSKEEMVTTSGLQVGQDLVLTKWAGLEGTAIIANDHEEELLTRYTRDFIKGAQGFMEHISVIKEARIGKGYGVTAMHDVTEGGIYGALWEIAAASGVGVEVDLKRIPLKQETVEFCEFFDLNPYKLISSGCMLMGTHRGNDLVQALEREGISAAVIGKVTEGHERIVLNEEERRFLEPPKSDEIYKVGQTSNK